MKDTTLRGYGHTVVEAPFHKRVDGQDVTEPGWQLLLMNVKDGELIRYPLNEETKADLIAKLSSGVIRASAIPDFPKL